MLITNLAMEYLHLRDQSQVVTYIRKSFNTVGHNIAIVFNNNYYNYQTKGEGLATRDYIVMLHHTCMVSHKRW